MTNFQSSTGFIHNPAAMWPYLETDCHLEPFAASHGRMITIFCGCGVFWRGIPFPAFTSGFQQKHPLARTGWLNDCSVHITTAAKKVHKVGHSQTHLMTAMIYNCNPGLNYDRMLRTICRTNRTLKSLHFCVDLTSRLLSTGIRMSIGENGWKECASRAGPAGEFQGWKEKGWEHLGIWVPLRWPDSLL